MGSDDNDSVRNISGRALRERLHVLEEDPVFPPAECYHSQLQLCLGWAVDWRVLYIFVVAGTCMQCRKMWSKRNPVWVEKVSTRDSEEGKILGNYMNVSLCLRAGAHYVGRLTKLDIDAV